MAGQAPGPPAAAAPRARLDGVAGFQRPCFRLLFSIASRAHIFSWSRRRASGPAGRRPGSPALATVLKAALGTAPRTQHGDGPTRTKRLGDVSATRTPEYGGEGGDLPGPAALWGPRGVSSESRRRPAARRLGDEPVHGEVARPRPRRGHDVVAVSRCHLRGRAGPRRRRESDRASLSGGRARGAPTTSSPCGAPRPGGPETTLRVRESPANSDIQRR